MSEPLKPPTHGREISVALDSLYGGERTLSNLSRLAKERGLNIIEPLTRSYFIREGKIDLTICSLEPFEHQLKDKGEDRIFCGRIGDFPVIIVADGVSAMETKGGQITLGGGEKAAAEAILSTIKTFSEKLKHGLESTEMYSLLKSVFEKAMASLSGKDIATATTLLIGLPYRHLAQKGGEPLDLWYYAYIGDGTISLISLERKIDGLPSVTQLLTPQKVEHTAALSAKKMSVLPVIGSVGLTPNDIMYVGSDGLDYITKGLIRKQKGRFYAIIYDEIAKGVSSSGGTYGGTMDKIKDRIKQGLGEDYIKNTINDDIVFGVMSTHR